MTADIVIATRSGVVSGPDGAKHRLIRGKTLADARHPVAREFPELFSPYTIDLPHEGDEPAAGADEYREQLAAIVEVLREHDALPDESEMNEPGWLARAVAALFDPVAPPPAPRRGPGRPRKQQP